MFTLSCHFHHWDSGFSCSPLRRLVERLDQHGLACCVLRVRLRMEGKREVREKQCQDGWLTNSFSLCRRSHCSGFRPLLCRKSGTADQGYQVRRENRTWGKKEGRKDREYLGIYFLFLFFLSVVLYFLPFLLLFDLT